MKIQKYRWNNRWKFMFQCGLSERKKRTHIETGWQCLLVFFKISTQKIRWAHGKCSVIPWFLMHITLLMSKSLNSLVSLSRSLLFHQILKEKVYQIQYNNVTLSVDDRLQLICICLILQFQFSPFCVCMCVCLFISWHFQWESWFNLSWKCS